MKVDTDILKKMLKPDRVSDLYDLMQGESKYSTDSTENMPSTEEEIEARHLAIEHVWFVSKFGMAKSKVVVGAKVHTAYPEYFEKWLELGAPGIVSEEVEAYLKENPL